MTLSRTPASGVSPFDATLVALPPEVEQASEDFATALARWRSAQAAVAQRTADLDAARAADKRAARAAVEAGKDPPAATTAKPADALDRAARAEPEARQLTAEAERRYLDVTAAHVGELQAAVSERQASVRNAGQSALDQLGACARELVALDVLYRELDPGWIRSRQPQFQPIRPERRKDVAQPIIDAGTAALSVGQPMRVTPQPLRRRHIDPAAA